MSTFRDCTSRIDTASVSRHAGSALRSFYVAPGEVTMLRSSKDLEHYAVHAGSRSIDISHFDRALR
jgi:hypothetical protein